MKSRSARSSRSERSIALLAAAGGEALASHDGTGAPEPGGLSTAHVRDAVAAPAHVDNAPQPGIGNAGAGAGGDAGPASGTAIPGTPGDDARPDRHLANATPADGGAGARAWPQRDDTLDGDADPARGSGSIATGNGTSGDAPAAPGLTITGTPGNDVLIGTVDDDVIFGGAGDDSLFGVSGVDTLHGDAGDDVLDGGFSTDTSYGGTGNDTFRVTGSAEGDHVFGGDGTDTLDLSGFTFSGAVVNLATGQYDYAPTPFGPWTIASVENVIGSPLADTITGGSAANSLSGGGDIDVIFGGDGNDTLFGGDNDDTLDGGNGHDTLFGGDDNDTLNGGSGNDTLHGGLDTDFAYGGDGDDVIRVFNEEFFDHAFGGAGTDTLDHSAVTRSFDTFDFKAGTITSTFDVGTPALSSIEVYLDGSGATTIVSAGTNATYFGNGGDDLMISEIGGETMDGGPGIDTIHHTRYGGNYTFNMATGLTNLPNELFLGFEYALMGGGDDSVTGSSDGNLISGSLGNDTIDGAGGADVLIGDAGDDVLDGGPGADTSYGGAGNDTFVIKGTNFADHVFGGPGTDTLDLSGHTSAALGFVVDLFGGTYDFTPTPSGPYTIDSVENVVGSARADTIIGSNIANSLTGGGGDDTLDGGPDIDTIFGGAGNDRIIINDGDTPDHVFGGAGTDTLDVSGSLSLYVINLATGQYDFIIPAGKFTINGVENVLGSTQGDTIIGSGAANVLSGNDGNDTIEGGGATDTVFGGAGNDLIRVLAGEFFDHVFGGTGTDTLDHSAVTRSGDTFDFKAGTITSTFDTGTPALSSIEVYLDGSGGNTIVSSGTGGTYHGNGGDDYMISEIGSETMFGGAGIDTVDHSRFGGNYIFSMLSGLTNGAFELHQGFENAIMGAGNDWVSGNGAANSIDGGAGNDTLDGAGNADTLFGGAGIDTLDGGDGNDVLDGGPGTDTSYGGAGNDTFLIRGTNFGDHVFGGDGTDTLDLSGHTSVPLGFVVNLLTGQYDFTTPAGPWTVSSVESVVGSARADTIIGSSLSDALNGFDGDDSLLGGGGNDVLIGGNGADRFFGGDGVSDLMITGDDGAVDHFDGGAGIADVVSYFSSGNGVTVNLANNAANTGAAAGETYTGVEGIRGAGSAANTLIGDAGGNVLVGGSAGDWISSGAGSDIIYGGAGNDVMNAGDNIDIIRGDQGDDTLTGGAGGDFFKMKGVDGNDTITDFAVLSDKVEFQVAGVNSFSDLVFQDLGGGNSRVIAGTVSVTFLGVALADIQQAGNFDFV